MNRAIRRACVMTGSVILAMSALAGPAHAATPDPTDLSATALAADSSYQAPKSTSGQLAESDQTLLRRTDSADVDVMVKLDYDAAASYDGSIAGLPATSPTVTGEELTGGSSAEQTYDAYTDKLDAQFRSRLAAELPAAVAGASLSTVYGGVAVRLPADQAKDLLDLPGVAAVQADVRQQSPDDAATGAATEDATAAAQAPAAVTPAQTTPPNPVQADAAESDGSVSAGDPAERRFGRRGFDHRRVGRRPDGRARRRQSGWRRSMAAVRAAARRRRSRRAPSSSARPRCGTSWAGSPWPAGASSSPTSTPASGPNTRCWPTT